MSEWIKCEDKLPETPKTWEEYVFNEKVYMVCWESTSNTYGYQSLRWCDGWNCSMMPDGTISREHEIKDVVAWYEVPEYKG